MYGRLSSVKIKEWLDWMMESTEVNGILRWIERSKLSQFRKEVLYVVMVALVYQVWRSRNGLLWNSKVPKETQVTYLTKEEVKRRIIHVWPKNVSTGDKEWFSNIVKL
ncbi:uncharacterized protein LOC133031122 [Cannabis sativa]|uniref:uncharacterized protein LOC133031122 n=1 Tax=Cannabis sativa TaxID=3483 RepID=UPI0029CA0715|nr:uncharacterized protein LOC133031122 [Cannabis sativa]